jgi:hypothetical protein
VKNHRIARVAADSGRRELRQPAILGATSNLPQIEQLRSPQKKTDFNCFAAETRRNCAETTQIAA